MWILARLVIGSVLVSGTVFGSGHVTRLIDTQALPDTPAIAVEEAAADSDDTSDTRRDAVAEAGPTAAPEAAYLPTASGAATRPTRRDDDDDEDTPASGAATKESATERVEGLAADLRRAVANGHATPEAAARFFTEVSGYIREDA